MREDFTATVGAAAVPELHDLAQRLYLVEDQPAWSPALRSRTALQQTPTRHLADPSLAASLMGAGTDRLLAEPRTLGFLFESQVVHDLRICAQALDARGVFHHRDAKGRDEMDAVVEAADGRWIGAQTRSSARVSRLVILGMDSAPSRSLCSRSASAAPRGRSSQTDMSPACAPPRASRAMSST